MSMEEEKDTSWEERAVGKNIHSVYVLCIACHTWGINEPLDKKCGNCGDEDDSYTYYDSETITEIIRQEREALLKGIVNDIEKLIQEERFTGAPHALSKVQELIKKKI